jgi:hypothetical protein
VTVEPTAREELALVTAVGRAEGSREAAAALACAGSDIDRAALLIDVDGRAPRPTLLASAAARRLEERLAAHLPHLRAAARGQTCHLEVSPDEEGLEAASAAATAAREGLAVMHVPPAHLQTALVAPLATRLTGALLRADVGTDRALVALVARDLIERGLRVAVLKRELAWVPARRALFGALPPGAAGGIPGGLLRKIAVEHPCYAGLDDAETDPAGAAERKRRDHAGTRSR